MSVSTVPARLPEPPPADMQLSAEGRVVGWAHPDRFGFHGFADEIEAARAASVAYRAVTLRLAPRGSHPANAPPGAWRDLAAQHPLAGVAADFLQRRPRTAGNRFPPRALV